MQATDSAVPEQHFSIEIEGQEMRVRFRPRHFGGYGHFEFTSPHEPRRRIIISETGYRSHFSPMWQVEEAPGVEAYAHALALGILRQNAAPAWADEDDEEEPAQLGLF